MDTEVRVRQARVEDAPGMARMHVRSWRETYRGVMSDRVLDDPELPAYPGTVLDRRAQR